MKNSNRSTETNSSYFLTVENALKSYDIKFCINSGKKLLNFSLSVSQMDQIFVWFFNFTKIEARGKQTNWSWKASIFRAIYRMVIFLQIPTLGFSLRPLVAEIEGQVTKCSLCHRSGGKKRSSFKYYSSLVFELRALTNLYDVNLWLYVYQKRQCLDSYANMYIRESIERIWLGRQGRAVLFPTQKLLNDFQLTVW